MNAASHISWKLDLYMWTQKEQILSRELSCPVRSGGPSRVKYVVTWRGAFPESVNISKADVTGITLHQGHSKGSSEKLQDSHLKCVLPASKKKTFDTIWKLQWRIES